MTDVRDALKESPFACDMGAIEPEKRGVHLTTISQLFQKVLSVRELNNGYAFQLPGEPGALVHAAEFIELERLCCPFFGFNLEVEAEGGSLWLSLTGRPGVKPFILAEIGEHLDAPLVKPEGLRRKD
ncbi:MAG TPA: hypothetical protein VF791_06365 [Pyrinomonadaceae bacterium]